MIIVLPAMPYTQYHSLGPQEWENVGFNTDLVILVKKSDDKSVVVIQGGDGTITYYVNLPFSQTVNKLNNRPSQVVYSES